MRPLRNTRSAVVTSKPASLSRPLLTDLDRPASPRPSHVLSYGDGHVGADGGLTVQAKAASSNRTTPFEIWTCVSVVQTRVSPGTSQSASGRNPVNTALNRRCASSVCGPTIVCDLVLEIS